MSGGRIGALLAAIIQVETPSIATSITVEAIGTATLPGQPGRKANCDDTGASTTIGSSSANISTFLTCESAICNSPSTSAIRGGESITPQ